MSHDNRVSIIVFDMNETLLDITTLEPLSEQVILSPGVSVDTQIGWAREAHR